MKKLIPTILSFLVTCPLHAAYTVYDPANHSQSIANNAAEIAKFIQVIDHQVQQINRLTDQLNEVRRYIDLFGTPAEIANVIGADQLIQDIQRPSIGITYNALQAFANGGHGMDYTASGLYRPIGRTFQTPGGTQITRERNHYRKYSALPKAIWNHGEVYTNIVQRRQALKTQISAVTQQLEASDTDAQTQKLTGVLLGLNATLGALDKEIDFALGHVLIQHADNENDQAKQRASEIDEQQAEFSESLTHFRGVFRLSAEPAHFPVNP